MPRRERGLLAVALHDVAPGTLEHCALIRDWLDDLGVDRVTLCVGGPPAPPPLPGTTLAAWLRERRARGDAVVLDPPHPPRLDRWTAAGLPRPLGPPTLRVHMRPADLDAGPRRTRAVERALRHAALHRRAITLEERAEPAARGIPADAPGVVLAP
jgi:hypothetical protein